MNVNQALPDEVMSYKELSVYLKLSQGTLRQKVMKGEIPFSKIGGSVRFSKKTIDGWFEENQQKAKKKNVKSSDITSDINKVER